MAEEPIKLLLQNPQGNINTIISLRRWKEDFFSKLLTKEFLQDVKKL